VVVVFESRKEREFFLTSRGFEAQERYIPCAKVDDGPKIKVRYSSQAAQVAAPKPPGRKKRKIS